MRITSILRYQAPRKIRDFQHRGNGRRCRFRVVEGEHLFTENHCCEKLDAVLSLIKFSSRMKDCYNIYYLEQKIDFDGATLTETMRKTFKNRGHAFTPEQFKQVINSESDAEMQKK